MIYLFHGSDGEKTRHKAFAWIGAARKKEPQLSYVRLAREELTANALEDVSASGGLFVKRLLVLIDDPYQKMRAKEEDEGEGEEGEGVLDEYLEQLAESENAIVILAPELSAPRVKKLSKYAKIVYATDLKTRAEKRGFNGALVNALRARKGEELWLEVERALRAGDAPEAVHGLLHWQARDILEKGARAWTPREARELSLALLTLLHDTRRNGLELGASLERFALTI